MCRQAVEINDPLPYTNNIIASRLAPHHIQLNPYIHTRHGYTRGNNNGYISIILSRCNSHHVYHVTQIRISTHYIRVTVVGTTPPLYVRRQKKRYPPLY